MKELWVCQASVAQLAEQWTFNPLVAGSSPAGSTVLSNPSLSSRGLWVKKGISLSKVVTIREEIAYSIRSGELLPGDRLPPQGEIADKYSAGVSTVRAALKPLKVLGLIYTARDGIFVGPRISGRPFPSGNAPVNVSCSVKKCKNFFEIRNRNEEVNFSRFLKKAGWTYRGSRESTLFFCHQCSTNRK